MRALLVVAALCIAQCSCFLMVRPRPPGLVACRLETPLAFSNKDQEAPPLPAMRVVPPEGIGGPAMQTYSLLILNFVAVLWGSQHAIIKGSVAYFGHPSLLIFWRFLLGCCLFAPALVSLGQDLLQSTSQSSQNTEVTNNNNNSSEDANMQLLRAGTELGLYTFLGFSLQAVGLETTTASRSAFLLYLNVKFVPILAVLFLGRRFPGKVWLSAALALAGTFFLSTDNGPAIAGDLWCILAALASGAFILRLEAFSSRFDAPRLNAVTFLTVLVLATAWVAADFAGSGTEIFGAGALYEELWLPLVGQLPQVLYLGVVSTALCNYLQTLGQRYVTATKASIIYSLDPLYGAGFSYLLLGEQLGPQGLLGGLLILAGVAVSSLGGEGGEGSVM